MNANGNKVGNNYQHKKPSRLNKANDIQIKLEIQLNEEDAAILLIKGDEDPRKTVDKFCEENDLDDDIKEHILQEVQNKIEENLQECI